MGYFFLWSCDEWVDFVQVFLLEQEVPSLEDLVLTRGDVGHARVDHNFLPIVVDVRERVLRLQIIELVLNVVVDLDLFFLILAILRSLAIVGLKGSARVLSHRYHRARHIPRPRHLSLSLLSHHGLKSTLSLDTAVFGIDLQV